MLRICTVTKRSQLYSLRIIITYTVWGKAPFLWTSSCTTYYKNKQKNICMRPARCFYFFNVRFYFTRQLSCIVYILKCNRLYIVVHLSCVYPGSILITKTTTSNTYIIVQIRVLCCFGCSAITYIIQCNVNIFVKYTIQHGTIFPTSAYV